MPYTIKFIMMVWLAFLARHRPVSTAAKPACINMTRKPVIRVQTKLIATLFCPTWLRASPKVSPTLGLETVTSFTVPVRPPDASPLAISSAEGGFASFTAKGACRAGAGVAWVLVVGWLGVWAQAGTPHKK